MQGRPAFAVALLFLVALVALTHAPRVPPIVLFPAQVCATNRYLGLRPQDADWEADYLRLLLQKTRGKLVYIFSSNQTPFEEARRIVFEKRPDVAIHLSDEWGKAPEFTALAGLCPLMLRQHDHPGYPRYANLHFMPLGFQRGMFPKGYPSSRSSKRSMIWAFVGDSAKNVERREMAATLQHLEPHYLGRADAVEMARLYRDCWFVPNARGNVVLDCFRLYEASACGAIPVLVGPKWECDSLLKRMGFPPWLVHENWQAAEAEMREIHADVISRRARSDAVLAWWWLRVQGLQKLLAA